MIRRHLLLSVALLGAAMALCTTPSRADDPKGQKFEAETGVASDSQVIDDPGASAGKAVSNGRAWQPISEVVVPTDGGDVFTVSARHRGGPIQLKAIVDGKQVDREWVWATPSAWAWSSFGTYSRAQLGERVVFMRGTSDKLVAIDAVVFSPGKVEAVGPSLPSDITTNGGGGALPPSRPDESLPIITVDATIDWNHVVGPVPAAIWGVADYEIKDPQAAADAGFNDFLAKIKPPLIRVHHGGFPGNWMNAEQTAWDVDKIKACWSGVRKGYGQTPVMLNISEWPNPMRLEDGSLDMRRVDDYAKLYVDLVKIMRDEVGRKIDYWEITNERDGLYEKLGKLPELWKIYNTVALAIKKEDPAALTGGPAFTWSKPLWVDGFVDNCIQNADFVTYHNYGIGDVHDGNEKLYATLDSVEGHARFIRAAVDKASPGRHVPIFLNEYNVKWVWNPIEPRHANSVGAVWQAGAVRRALLAGIDGATVWHVKGNAYGIIDGENKPRPTAAMFEWGPKWMVGNMTKATVDDKNAIELLPIETPGGGRSLLVICKANHSVRLPPAGQLLGGTPTHVMRVDADGVHTSLVVDSATPLIVPGYSLTLLTNSTK